MGTADPQALLKFIWKLMPPETSALVSTTQLKFYKNPEEMRRRTDLKKAVYMDPNLRLDNAGNEFEVINGTAKALARLPPSRPSKSDEPIEEPPKEGDNVQIEVTTMHI
mmetsp:Transcript_63191/g.142777  ORF Transcript_63191/g.142777 Transcript_63191/m.142777 type:complete len:109 (+) Transcript_63191:47-373(+)